MSGSMRPTREPYNNLIACQQGTQMTAEQFSAWLDEMKEVGLARSDAECARRLGLSSNSVLAMKQRGTDRRTALACRALLHRLEPYPD